jgi:TonB-dependent receptor
MMEKSLQSRLLNVVTLVALTVFAMPMEFAMAQDDDEVIEEVVVKGFRGSLKLALDAKREATGAVDSIMAEDIADFPDSNLAEALQRIPGIAITREAGEGRNITVRGLDAKFTRVTMNGTMAQSLAAGSGGAQTNRSFDFNIFASELFNRIDVYKSTSAEMEEGSLGATVALHTPRPFDYEAFTLAGNVQASYNDQSSETNPRASGLVSWTNDDNTFGALLSVAFSERFVNNTGPQTGRWENDNFASCSACGGDAALEQQVYAAYHPRFPRYADKTHDHERTGVTASFQFAPADTTLITADILTSTVDGVRTEPFMQAISLVRTGSTGVQQTDVADFTLDGPAIIAATMDGVDTRSENFLAEWDSDFTQYQIKLDQDLGERGRMNLMYSTSEAKLNNREITLALEHFSEGDGRENIVYAESADAVTYDYSSMLSPTISYNWDTTNPANWEFSEYRDRPHRAESGFDTIQLGFEYDLSDDLTLKFGFSNKEYSFWQTQSRADALFDQVDGGSNDPDGVADGVACGIPAAVDASQGSVVSFGATPYFMMDVSEISTFANSACWPQNLRTGDTRQIVEDDDAYYVQLDFFGDIAGMDLRGNVGVREVTTNLASTGITNAGGELIEVVVDNDYTDTLPAINLALDINDDLVARFGWAKVISRPDISLLSPGGSVTLFGVPAVSYGNPFLEPYRADNLDVALEWYFDSDAVLALAYFDRDIETFPSSETVLLPWSEVGLPDSVLGAQIDDLIDEEFEVTRRINGGGARLNGWEIQYQQQFSMLPGIWSNTGVIANYTWVDSKTDGSGLPLTGQSDDSYNLTAYYEDDKFSTRLAYSYRGEFNTRNDSNNPVGVRYRDATANLDFSASYTVNENLRVTLEAINLTDEPQIDYLWPAIGGLLIETQYTGTQWMLGASYKY